MDNNTISTAKGLLDEALLWWEYGRVPSASQPHTFAINFSTISEFKVSLSRIWSTIYYPYCCAA